MDMKTTFFRGNLNEKIYIEHSDGFSDIGHDRLVYKLQNSLYGLK